jgi:hypothetical protein
VALGTPSGTAFPDASATKADGSGRPRGKGATEPAAEDSLREYPGTSKGAMGWVDDLELAMEGDSVHTLRPDTPAPAVLVLSPRQRVHLQDSIVDEL